MPASTWSTTDKSTNVVLSGGNLSAVRNTTSQGGVRGKDPKRSGKYYFEIQVTTSWNSGTSIGISNFGRVIDTVGSNVYTPPTALIFRGDGQTLFMPTQASAGSFGVRAAGDIIGFAIDLDTPQAWMRVAPAGNWNANASNNPATGVGGFAIPGLGAGGIDAYPFAFFNNTGDIAVANFGATAFSGAVPSGFTSGWDDTIAALSNLVVTQQGAVAWASSNPDVQVTQIGAEVIGSTNPNYQLTQVGEEVWAAGTPAVQLTQVGLEMWATVTTGNVQMILTQIGREIWAPVPVIPSTQQARTIIMA